MESGKRSIKPLDKLFTIEAPAALTLGAPVSIAVAMAVGNAEKMLPIIGIALSNANVTALPTN